MTKLNNRLKKYLVWFFIFMLPCIVIDFFSTNQPDALIIQIYSVIKLYMFRASSLHIIRSFLHKALVSFMQIFNDLFEAESGWNYAGF